MPQPINITNYEIYALDYLEGRLSPAVRKEMEKFLAENPAVREEMEDISGFALEHIPVQEDFSGLHIMIVPTASIGENNYEEVMAAGVEGDLDDESEKELKQFLQFNPGLQEEWKTMQQCKVEREPMVFPRKEKLKKKSVVFRPAVLYPSVAAAVLLLIGLFFYRDLSGPDAKPGMAVNSKIPLPVWSYQPRNTPVNPVAAQTVPENIVQEVPVKHNLQRQETEEEIAENEIAPEPVIIFPPENFMQSPAVVENQIPDKKAAEEEYIFLSGTKDSLKDNDEPVASYSLLKSNVKVFEEAQGKKKKRTISIDSPFGDLGFKF